MVNGLQGEIEEERRLKLNDMEENLQKLRRDAIEKLPNEGVDQESICELLRHIGSKLYDQTELHIISVFGTEAVDAPEVSSFHFMAHNTE
jgi:hypothetical protein